ncbi:pseudouridylate synthase [Leptospira inadai serovar Lyme str. 10]|uniref:Pseudouridine synthase n=2 Tax=Leptospira inadai serovar Lyme TaxID=293084 RepID=V6HAC2_9LEPT|nr:pseudouridine synthase [Leptospira inadai]EQA36107.1 pseudouridylate synthase [Leptospira inadai serovar Lyme str. 10]PNV74847.1 rRNA pseudouridine synthase [Leptospira inadai serovar Lyme]
MGEKDRGQKPELSEERDGIRINRFLADCGFGSRRKVEELILNGNVFLNGKSVRDLSTRIRPGKDEVFVRNKKAIPRQGTVFLALNKPAGYLCSHGDRFHNHTVFELLPSKYGQLAIAGRLDLDSRGLLLLSDDGELVHLVSHPSHSSEKEYEVSLQEPISVGEAVRRFREGIVDEGETLKAESILAESKGSEASRFRIILRQGRKRQIRRMFSALGGRVTDLQRVRIGNLRLKELGIREGEYTLLDPQKWRP